MRWRVIYCAYFCLLILLFFIVLLSFLRALFCHHFLSFWRALFSHSLRIGLLAINSVRCSLSENVFISSYFLKDSITKFMLRSWQFFIQHLKNFVPLPSDPHGFRGEVHCHLNCCSFVGSTLFLFSCFQEFFLCF